MSHNVVSITQASQNTVEDGVFNILVGPLGQSQDVPPTLAKLLQERQSQDIPACGVVLNQKHSQGERKKFLLAQGQDARILLLLKSQMDTPCEVESEEDMMHPKHLERFLLSFLRAKKGITCSPDDTLEAILF